MLLPGNINTALLTECSVPGSDQLGQSGMEKEEALCQFLGSCQAPLGSQLSLAGSSCSLPLLHRTLRPAEGWAEGSGACQHSGNSGKELHAGHAVQKTVRPMVRNSGWPWRAVPMVKTTDEAFSCSVPGLTAQHLLSSSRALYQPCQHHLAVMKQASHLPHPLCHLPLPRLHLIK